MLGGRTPRHDATFLWRLLFCLLTPSTRFAAQRNAHLRAPTLACARRRTRKTCKKMSGQTERRRKGKHDDAGVAVFADEEEVVSPMPDAPTPKKKKEMGADTSTSRPTAVSYAERVGAGSSSAANRGVLVPMSARAPNTNENKPTAKRGKVKSSGRFGENKKPPFSGGRAV